MLVLQKGKVMEHKPLISNDLTLGKRFKIKLATPVSDIKNILSTIPGITELVGEFPWIEFSYIGDDGDQASLLKNLVLNNIPISEITESKLNLQEEYLKTLKK